MDFTRTATIFLMAMVSGSPTMAASPTGIDTSLGPPPSPVEPGEPSGSTSIPVRTASVSSLTLAATSLSTRMDELIITWRTGPPCTGAGATSGVYDHVEVKETRRDVIVKLFLRDAIANPALTSSSKKCLAGTRTHVRIVPLERPLGARIVHDWACPTSCRVPRLEAEQRRALLAALR